MTKNLLAAHEVERITATDGTVYRIWDDGNHLTFHIFTIERFYPTAPNAKTTQGKPVTIGTHGYWQRVPRTEIYTDYKQAHDKLLEVAAY